MSVDASTPIDQQEAALRYLRGQVLPRSSELIKSRALFVAVLGGGLLSLLIPWLPVADKKIATVAGALLDYAAIGLGACITALVLAISLAPERRVQEWSHTYTEGSRHSAYSHSANDK